MKTQYIIIGKKIIDIDLAPTERVDADLSGLRYGEVLDELGRVRRDETFYDVNDIRAWTIPDAVRSSGEVRVGGAYREEVVKAVKFLEQRGINATLHEAATVRYENALDLDDRVYKARVSKASVPGARE